MKRQSTALGELCSLVKGNSPISKATPGRYPLVTTGEDHKTAATFQFDVEAVCIPLISSTGHGHASLKRVHYQVGKFALGNLLAAALVKDTTILSTKFLARYLMYAKDRLIVPLMTGSANMSISINRLATVPVHYPSLIEQDQIVKLLDEADDLCKLRAKSDYRSIDLIPSFFYEMFGDPLTNSRGWPMKELRQLGRVVTGSTPSSKKEGMFGGDIPFITPGDLENNTREPMRYVTEIGAKEARTVRAGSALVCCIGATIGKTDRAWKHSAFNQQINAVEWNEAIDDDFGVICLKQLSKLVIQKSNQTSLPILKKSLFEQIPIPVPPIELQKEFSNRLVEIRRVEVVQSSSRNRIDDLFQSMFYRAFEGELWREL